MKDYPYPCTVICDRYSGVYSGAMWTAWPTWHYAVPEDVDGGDLECQDFWLHFPGTVGKGSTPDEAVDALIVLLNGREPLSIDFMTGKDRD